jgi:hypothetical protein
MRRPPHRNPAPFALAAILLALAGPARAEPPKPALALQAVKVEPASPRRDTLCHLAITLKNGGDQPASALELAVKVNGRELPAYGKRLYLTPVEPGATRELRLFNFWSSEAGRPVAANGKLAVEVTLVHASWMRKTSRDGAEVWTPAGEVPGLPATQSITLTMAK